MSYVSIGYDQLEKYRDRVLQSVIYIGDHKAKNHTCEFTRYNVMKGKICAHVMLKYGNCEGNHQAIVFTYQAWLKYQMQVWRIMSQNPFRKDIQSSISEVPEKELVAKSVKIKVDTSLNFFTKNLK